MWVEMVNSRYCVDGWTLAVTTPWVRLIDMFYFEPSDTPNTLRTPYSIYMEIKTQVPNFQIQ